MELRQLKCLIVLAEELNFRKAAAKLNITQPPFSRHIQQLEAEIGAQLFIRNKQKVKITEVGSIILKEAKRVVVSAENLKLKALEFSKVKEIQIGYIGLASIAFLPELTSFLHKKNIPIKLRDYSSNIALIEALENEDIVYALHYPIKNLNIFESEVIYKEPIVIIMHQEHPLAKKEYIELKDLPNQKYIMPPSSSNPLMNDRFFFLAHQIGFEPKVIQEVNSHYDRLSLVSQGLGITFDGISVKKLNIPNLIYKKEHPSYALEAQIVLSWRKNEKSEQHEDLIDFFNTKN